MVRINWTIQAVNDLKNIKEYISKDSVRYARLQLSRIRVKAEILKYHPESGRIVPEIDKIEVRELIEGNYRIIYRRYDSENIDILTVHHSAKVLHKKL